MQKVDRTAPSHNQGSINVLKQLATALKFLHQTVKVVHRDVKP